MLTLFLMRRRAPSAPQLRCGTLDLLRVKGIPLSAYGLNEVRLTVPVQGLPEPAHVHIHRPDFDTGVLSPESVDKLLARESATRVRHEELQQPVLRRGQLDRPSGPGYPASH